MPTRGYFTSHRYCYQAMVKEVLTRSTMIMDIDLGFNIKRYDQRYKILKINEHVYKSSAINAKYKVLGLVRPGDKIIIKSECVNRKMYCEIITNNNPTQLYHYKSKMYNIVDGDTIDIELDLGFTIHYIERFRIYGINAWEKRGPDKQKGLLSKSRVAELLPIGSSMVTKTFRDTKGKYGRYIGDIFIPNNPKTLSQILVEEGHAVWQRY